MQNLDKEIKEVGAGTVGINIAMFTILYSWLLMMIPAFVIQLLLKIDVEDALYRLIIIPFQIIAAVIGNRNAIKAAVKNIKVKDSITKVKSISVVITSMFVFFIEIVVGTGTLVPLKNILGFIVLVITYVLSNNYFLKKML